MGGASALSIYTILFLKLYSYKDVNLWCRELSTIKVKKLSRSLSCKCTRTLSLKKPPQGAVWVVIDTHTESNSNVIDIGKYINYQFLADATSKGTSTEAFGFVAKGIKDDTLSAERIVFVSLL